MRTPVIAIDGPAGSGKGTLAKRLASELGYAYLDTGLLYRAVGKKIVDAGSDPSNVEVATRMAVSLTLSDLDAPGLRGEAMGRNASICSCIPGVRAALLEYQQDFASNPPGGVGAILDGRDIGTAVCPDANLKIWVTASAEARAQRRHAEDPAGVALADILLAITERDHRETTREASPMIPASDARQIDTTAINASAAFAQALAWAKDVLPPDPARARPKM